MYTSHFSKFFIGIVSLFLASSCSWFDDLPTFMPGGTYNVGTVEIKGTTQQMQGTVTIQPQGDASYNLAFRGVGAVTQKNKDLLLGFDLNTSIDAIDTKAYKITFKQQDFERDDIPFSLTLDTPSSVSDLITEMAGKAITFEDKSIKATYNGTIMPPPSDIMVAYGGANYMGVLQKDKMELSFNYTATVRYPVIIDSALLVRTIKDSKTKQLITSLLNYSGIESAQVVKKKAITDYVNLIATTFNTVMGKNAAPIKSEYKLTLTK